MARESMRERCEVYVCVCERERERKRNTRPPGARFASISVTKWQRVVRVSFLKLSKVSSLLILLH